MFCDCLVILMLFTAARACSDETKKRFLSQELKARKIDINASNTILFLKKIT